MKYKIWEIKGISSMLVIVLLTSMCATTLINTNRVSAKDHASEPRRAIMLTGYWNPTGQMIEKFSQNTTLNPGGWQGANWEDRGYDIYSFFPFKRYADDSTYYGDFEIDYQDVSSDFSRITSQLHPIAIISFGGGSSTPPGWEIEYNARNLEIDGWRADPRGHFPNPCPPDDSVPVGFIRHSTLPVQAIADAVTEETNHVLPAMVDWHDFPGNYLCEYMAYHDAWYQSLHNDPGTDSCLAAGFIHIAYNIPLSDLITATETTLRTTIQYLDEVQAPIPTSWGPGTVPVANNVTIPEGSTLHVQQGTRVVFAQGKHLAVKGTLWANGTQSEPITFTSQDTTYGWQGIQFLNWSAKGRLVNCTIANATWNPTSTGVTISGSRDHSIEVSHCLITMNNYGIRLFDASSPIDITQCNITNNGEGIFLSSLVRVDNANAIPPMHPRINYNSLLGNQQYAIEIERAVLGQFRNNIDAQHNYFGTTDPLQLRTLISGQRCDYSNMLAFRPSNVQILNGAQTWNNNQPPLTTGIIVNGDLTIRGITVSCNAPIGWNFIQVNGNLIVQNAHILSLNGDATVLCTARPNLPPELNSFTQSIIDSGVRLGIHNRTMSLTNTQVRGSRSGICFINCSGGMLSDCTVSANYGDGITFINTRFSTITDCTFTNNHGDGVTLIRSFSNIFLNCNMSHNNNNGIALLSGSPGLSYPYYFYPSYTNTITNCTITNNQDNGVLLVSFISGGHILSTTIKNCTITRNQGNGISLCQAYCYDIPLSNNVLVNSTIAYNDGDGILLFQTVSDTVKNCSVFNNHGDGITLKTTTGGSAVSGNNITECRVFNNQGNGISFDSYGWDLYGNNISNCTIVFNQKNGINMDFFVHRAINPPSSILGFTGKKPNLSNHVLSSQSGSTNAWDSPETDTEVSSPNNGIDDIDSTNEIGKEVMTEKPVGIGIDIGNHQLSTDDLLCSFRPCSLNSIFGNFIADNDNGICLTNISNNTVRHNTLQENWRNIQLIDSIHNNISANNMLSLSILTNMRKSYDNGDNRWNTTYQNGGGNYWNDFDEPSEGAYDLYSGELQNADTGGDGIIDLGHPPGGLPGGLNPYMIPEVGNRDFYPLRDPWGGDPVAVPDFYIALAGNTLYVSAPGVLGNDHDRDHHDLLAHFARFVMHGTLDFNTNGGFAYVPSLGFHGVDWFTYTDSDGTGTSHQVTVLILVIPGNTAPVANADTTTVLEDSVANRINVLANDSDVDGDALRICAVTPPSSGTVSMGRTYVLYTPNPNFNGMDSFTYTITDHYGRTNIATVTVNVIPSPVNDLPVAVGDTASVIEDSSNNQINVLANDYDYDPNDHLGIISVTQPSQPYGTVTFTTDFVYYTPIANYNGPDSFTYTISDGHDGGTASAPVTIIVTPVNDAPVVTDIPDQTVAEGSTFATINLDNYVSDVDNTDAEMAWTYSGNTQLTVNINANRVATITIPNLDWNGQETITFRATDPGLLYSQDAAVFTVTPVNDPPQAQNDFYFVNEDTTLTVSAPGVLSNDIDIDGPSLLLSAQLSSPPSHGTLTLNADGSFTYIPELNYFGTDQFFYKAFDGQDSSLPATVTITVNGLPISFDNPDVWTRPHTLVAIHLSAMDPDNWPSPLQYIIVSGPIYGTLNTQEINDPSHMVKYMSMPQADWPSDSFTFRVYDGEAFSNVATVSITISEIPPN